MATIGFLCGGLTGLQGQGGAPDLILVNAKIVTVDDAGFSDRLGTVAEAMAVKNGVIVRLGSSEAIRDMADPQARVYDLKGRTVLPGIVDVHEHPNDWDPVTPAIVKHALRDEVVVARFLEGKPEDQLKQFTSVLREAVSKAKPGQWIYIVFTFGKQYEYGTRGNSLFGPPGLDFTDGKLIPKALLNNLAPNNPVVVRDIFIGMLINDRAYQEAKKIYASEREGGGLLNAIDPDNEFGKWGNFRWMFSDVIMRDRYPLYREIARLGQTWWAGYGVTTYASECYNATCVKVYSDLERSGEKAIRNMFKWNWRQPYFFDDDYFIHFVTWAEDRGSDYFWYGGSRPIAQVGSSGCTALPRLDAAVAASDGKPMYAPDAACSWDPGTEDRERLYKFLKTGGRFANIHTAADKDIDNLLDVIEQASRDAGMTLEQIRTKRHGFDHLVLAPRPDQIPRLQRLGMVTGGNIMEIVQASPGVLKAYGEKAVEQVVPKKSLQQAGIANGIEVDRALGATDLTLFWNIARLIDRKAWDGKTYAPEQRLSRQAALKSATAWGAYYLMREDRVGSLAPGKYADFIVLDRDYLTVPEQEIEQLRVLMTAVGGKVVHLVPSLARELNLKPTGAQVELGFHPARW
ncbi:MAG: amidohydrolase family protein [Acidobacteria bacterium]|nr:amidohydrolase family protein [Acidobacteriota bacterium]